MSLKRIAAVAAAAVIGVGAIVVGTAGVSGNHSPPTKTVTVTKTKGAEPVYIRNLSKFISDKEIVNSIPAWEKSINVDFAKYWHTAQYKLIFIGKQQAPHTGITAEFVNKGPMKGALAYHWTDKNNAPSITVYAGTGAYFGYDNSVSFTHELQELAADPVTSYLNVGYPAEFYWLQKPNGDVVNVDSSSVIGWFSEVSDPVEADSYTRPGADGTPVKISDFVTPAWFNDGVGSRYDFMGLCQQPFWIRPGGYAQYFDFTGWNLVTNWRKHKHDALWAKDHDKPGRK